MKRIIILIFGVLVAFAAACQPTNYVQLIPTNTNWAAAKGNGTLQYNLSTHKLQARINGVTENFATESWVSSLSAVTSVFTRTGAVTAQSGDYSSFYPLLSGSYSNPSWITSLAWSKLTGTPTTLSGYGITDPIVLTSGSYSNPAWITSLAWSKITSTPTTLSGYAISDAQPLDGDLTAIAALSTNGFAKRTGTNTWAIDGTTYISGSGTSGYLAIFSGTNTLTVDANIDWNSSTKVLSISKSGSGADVIVSNLSTGATSQLLAGEVRIDTDGAGGHLAITETAITPPTGSSISFSALQNIPVLDYGTHTPTLTNANNLDSQTASPEQYLRVGNSVTVSGEITLDPTANATSTSVSMSFPIASNITATYQVGGSVNEHSAFVNQSGSIYGDTVNDVATIQFISNGTSSKALSYTYTYLIN